MRLKSILLSGLLFGVLSVASQPFSTKELKGLNQTVDSLLNMYVKFAAFTVDGNSISELYKTRFRELFSSPQVNILNDLDPKGKTPEAISVETYLSYLSKWYPTGLGVNLYDINKKTPLRKENHIEIEVDVKKDLLGFYLNRERYNKVFDLTFTMVIDHSASKAVIKSISNRAFDEKKRTYDLVIRETDILFENKKYQEARSGYENASLILPSEKYPVDQIKKCDYFLALEQYEKRKPIFLSLNIQPHLSSVSVSTPGEMEGLKTTPSINLGAGVGIELDLYANKARTFSGGVGVGLNLTSITSRFALDNFSDSAGNHVDIDHDTCTLLINLQDVNEKLKITYLDVPLFLQMRLTLGKKVYLTTRAGIKMDVAMSVKYASTATGDYRGQYHQYNNIVLYGNELDEYGYGSYEVTDEDVTNHTINPIHFSVFGAIGFRLQLSEKTSLFANLDYTYGLSNMFAYGSSDHHLSIGNKNLESISGFIDGRASVIIFELGICLRIY